MKYLDELLDQVLREVQVDDATVSEAKSRRTAVLDAAAGFDGVLRQYRSGSLAYGTAITPPPNKPTDRGVDGDGGIVLKRTVWTTLGPDSSAEQGPSEVVGLVQNRIRPILCENHPDLTVGKTTKRAILVKFNEPLASGEDPPVELIVAVIRQAGGLWIPNLVDDDWDPADPVTHAQLINEQPKLSLRRRRARVMRLVKHWNKKMTQPAFSSFHLQALALEVIGDSDVGCQLRTTVQRFFQEAAEALEEAMTEDPAGVSGVFHLENDVTRDLAVERLRAAGAAIEAANGEPDDQELVRAELKKIFHPDTVEKAVDEHEFAALSRGHGSVSVGAAGSIGSRLTPSRSESAKRPAAWSRGK